MRTRTWCVAAALLSLSAPAVAQTVLSEADALARLSSDSPRVRAIRAGVAVTRAEVLAAARWPNPRATFNRESVAGVSENMWTISQALPITGRRSFEMNAASALVAASASRADDLVRRARAELRGTYADLVSAQVREAEFTRARDRLRDLAGVLGRREDAGEAAGYDRLRADREVIELEAELATAQADRARAQAGLTAFFSDVVGATSLVAVAPSVNRQPLPSIDELVARAETTRGELAAIGHEAEAARLAERAAGRRAVPEPELVAGTKSSSLGTGDIGSVFSVHVTVPLFDHGTPEKARAQAQAAEADAKAAAFRTAVRAEIAALRGLVEERRAAADRYRAASAGNVEELERIAQVSYEAGERGILELLDAYRNGGTVRTRQAMLDAAVRQAEIELEFVSGWEIQ